MYLNFYRVCHFVKKVTSRCKIKQIKTRYIMGFFYLTRTLHYVRLRIDIYD